MTKPITVNPETGEVIDGDLSHHEATIDRGLKTFVEVGQALQAIRDGKLYHEQYDRFEDYCKERWGWARNYANKMIAAAEVTTSLGTNVPMPATESVARPLTKLPADEQAEAWEEVVTESESTGEKVTAKKVEQVVARRRDPQPKAHRVVEQPQSRTIEELIEHLEVIANKPNSMIVMSELRGVVAAIKSLVI